MRKKLIEVALPLDAINAASSREKSIRHGHPSTLHLWWARRPLAAARAVIFAQMVDDPSEYIDVLLSDPATKRAAQRALKKRRAGQVEAAGESPAAGNASEPGLVGERFEQPPADDLEPLFGAGRPPRRLDASDDVAQAGERLAAALTAHLDVVGLRVRGIGGVRCREADDEQTVAGQLRGFGQRLGEGELGLEAAGRQVALVVKLARVGDPLVNQDQARPVLDEERSRRTSPGLVACSSSLATRA